MGNLLPGRETHQSLGIPNLYWGIMVNCPHAGLSPASPEIKLIPHDTKTHQKSQCVRLSGMSQSPQQMDIHKAAHSEGLESASQK